MDDIICLDIVTRQLFFQRNFRHSFCEELFLIFIFFYMFYIFLHLYFLFFLVGRGFIYEPPILCFVWGYF